MNNYLLLIFLLLLNFHLSISQCPSSLSGKSITGKVIVTNAYAQCYKISTLSIASTITYIGFNKKYAFITNIYSKEHMPSHVVLQCIK
jgi:hypothetical protein